MERWSGRVALVTGSSAGVGAALAKKLVQSGMKVFACARNIQKIEELKQECEKAKYPGSLFPIKCDLRKEDEILAMFSTIKEQAGGVDVCVNNAGMGVKGDSLVEGKTEHWRDMMEVNLLAYGIVAREALKSMRSRNVDDGHLVYINSEAGLYFVDCPDWHFYVCTKHGVTAQAEGMRKELRHLKSHIRVTNLCPGFTETEFFKRAGGDQFHQELFGSGDKALAPEDVADGVMYALAAPPHVQVFQMTLYSTEEPI